jgi:putative DNA primase/helicase
VQVGACTCPIIPICTLSRVKEYAGASTYLHPPRNSEEIMGKANVLAGDLPQITINDVAIPLVLRAAKRWIRWHWGRERGKLVKKPQAGWNQPAAWRTFDDLAGDGDGAGFVLGDGFSGIDLDDCRDECTGDLSDLGKDVVALANSYCEVSHSGTGVKILVRGSLPQGAKTKTKGPGIEVYSQKRWFAITGNGTGEVESRQTELEAIYTRYVAADPMLGKLINVKPRDGENDGSRRLISVARTCLESGLTHDQSIAIIRQYETIYPFPRSWSDADISKRLTDAAPNVQRKFALTDTGNAELFAAQHGGDVRYVYLWGKWLIWNGRCWGEDTTGEVMRRAKRTARSIYDQATQCDDPDRRQDLAKFAAKCESAQKLNAMLSLAKSEQPIPATIESLDAQPWLLNVENGTIDLRTGTLREHRREDYLTKLCPTPLEFGEPKLWLQFLNQILSPELVDFVQRLTGASLVGEVRDEIFPILYGTGANGKTVLLNTWSGMLGGDYACTAPPALLKTSKQKQHPTEIATFYGKRLVTVSETDDNCRLSEALVKQLTGGDLLTARRMNEDFWSFAPSHTLVLASNYKPTISGTDHGIWRRIRLVPFIVTIAESAQDRELTAKLRSEYAAILAWAVKGCLEWQKRGLSAPNSISEATSEYKIDSDPFGRFTAECLIAGGSVTRKEVYEVYQRWCVENNDEILTSKKFVARMLTIATNGATQGVRLYRGFSLKPYLRSLENEAAA